MSTIQEVQLLCGSSQYNHGTFHNVEILMCHTNLSQLTDTFDVNYTGNTPELVFSAQTLELNWVYNQWHGFEFDPLFEFDGNNNMILEFRWQGDNDSSVYAYGWMPTEGYRTLDGYSLSNPTGTLRDYMNRLRVFYMGICEVDSPSAVNQCHLSSQPNPFNTLTTIGYNITEQSRVSLAIYDINGRNIKTLLSNAEKESGYHLLQWDGTDDYGKYVGTGVYFCKFKSNNADMTKKIILTE